MSRNNIHTSIIIPSKNSEKTIETAINFWLEQDFKDVEIIVVDDSTDETREIVEKFSKNVRIYSGANRGSGAARNIGLKKAVGK